MPTDKNNHLEYQVKAAEERLLGTKFCFACQKGKPIQDGKYFNRGKIKLWKCAQCVAKTNKGGFKHAA